MNKTIKELNNIPTELLDEYYSLFGEMVSEHDDEILNKIISNNKDDDTLDKINALIIDRVRQEAYEDGYISSLLDIKELSDKLINTTTENSLGKFVTTTDTVIRVNR